VRFGTIIFAAICVLIALPLCPAVARAAEAPAADEGLPAGEEIIERSIEVSGGREAFAKLKNRVAEGTLEIKGMGIKGTLTVYQARPNKNYTKVDIPDLGSIDQGTDGEVVWELNVMTGPRVKQGEERAAMLLFSQFDDTDYAELYEKIECVGTEEIEGEVCYKVVCTPKDAMPITTFYSRESGLAMKAVLTLPHLFGKIAVETLLGDYKEVDGILLPHRTVEKALTVESHGTITSYKHNVELPEGRFDAPPEIRALLNQGPEE
jgi:hypothetical protein